MTQCNSLNVKLSNSQLNKLKSAIKNETEVVLRLSSNMVGDDETSFSHKLLLTNRQVANLRKAFANYLSTDIKLAKTQISKKIQSGGFLGRLLGPDMGAADFGSRYGNTQKNLRIRSSSFFLCFVSSSLAPCSANNNNNNTNNIK